MRCFYRTKTRVILTHLTKQSDEMKEITLRVPDSMVHLIEAWAEHVPEMEIVTRKESRDYGLDDINLRMALALKVLKQNGAIRYGYDYAWIMVAIGDGVVDGLGGFKSPQRFMDYMNSLGVEQVPSRTTLSTWFGRVLGKYPNWEFVDTQDPQEIQRRKNVVRQLVSVLNRAANGDF